MYALHVNATQQFIAAPGRSVAVRVWSDNGMTIDLPRGR